MEIGMETIDDRVTKGTFGKTSDDWRGEQKGLGWFGIGIGRSELHRNGSGWLGMARYWSGSGWRGSGCFSL